MELAERLRRSDRDGTWSDRDGQTRFRGVYGNIDGADIRSVYPEQLVFMCEEVKVMLRHIGGYPPRYNAATKKELLIHRPQLFISGHSHILKIMYDEQLGCLHMNPGAAGNQGWHKVRTLIRFVIDGKEMKNCEVIELGKRG
jgi:predicted phosphodiesterase